jgi:hypothetical protein
VAGKRRRRRSSDSDEDDSSEDSENVMTTSDDDVVALSDDGGASAGVKRGAAARVRAPRERPPPKTAEQLAHERQWRGYEAIMYRVVTPAAEAAAGLVRLDGREGRAVPRPGMTAVAVPWEPERPVLLVGSILSVQQRGGASTSSRKTAAARAERDAAAATSTPVTYEVTLCPSSRGLGVYTGSDVFVLPDDVDAARDALEAYFNGSDPVEDWHAATGVNLGYMGSRL